MCAARLAFGNASGSMPARSGNGRVRTRPEARCEELRWAEVESRARAGSLKWQLDRSRSKLEAAVEETQEVRRTAKDALSLQAEVTRLEKLLSEASIEPAKHRPTSPADKARRRLRATLEQAENQKATIKSLRAERGELRKEVTRLNRELARLGKRLAREEQASERHKETIRRQYDEDIQHRAALRRLRDQSDRVRSLTEEVFWLRIALDGAKAGREALKARTGQAPGGRGDAVEAAVRRGRSPACGSQESRRQKTTINVLSKENARLRRAIQDPPRSRTPCSPSFARPVLVSLYAAPAPSCAGRCGDEGHAVVQGERPAACEGISRRWKCSARFRARSAVEGAVRRAPGVRAASSAAPPDGRQRPGSRSAPKSSNRRRRRVCAPVAGRLMANGVTNPPSSQGLQTRHPAPPVAPSRRSKPRLFPRTLSGPEQLPPPGCRVDVRPGVPISTLANSLKRFVAVRRCDPRAPERHADETGWRVQALRGEDRSSRAWFSSAATVSFHIDASRSAEAALELFGEALLDTVIVGTVPQRLARLREGLVTLAFCWSHQRRDFTSGEPDAMVQGWVEQAVAGSITTPAANASVRRRLKEALDGLFAEADELAGLPDQARARRCAR